MAPAPVPPCRTSVNTCGHLFLPPFLWMLLSCYMAWTNAVGWWHGHTGQAWPSVKQRLASITQTETGMLGWTSLPGSPTGGTQPVPLPSLDQEPELERWMAYPRLWQGYTELKLDTGVHAYWSRLAEKSNCLKSWFFLPLLILWPCFS